MLKTNESGRSMVEMLGVLAIIGVLSVGGIAGYTMAMNKYRANEIANAASLTIVEATAAGEEKSYTPTFGSAMPSNISSYVSQITANPTALTVELTLADGKTKTDEPIKSFCDQLPTGKKIGDYTVSTCSGE